MMIILVILSFTVLINPYPYFLLQRRGKSTIPPAFDPYGLCAPRFLFLLPPSFTPLATRTVLSPVKTFDV